MEVVERRGGCFAASYGGGGEADVAWRVGRIMQRFRPIAPKPAAMAAAGAVPLAKADAGGGGKGGGKAKRKAASGGSREGRRGRKPRKVDSAAAGEKSSASSSSAEATTSADSCPIVTLPLMPEAPGMKAEATSQASAGCEEMPAWLRGAKASATEAAAVPRAVMPAESWVTVESVTGTWRDGEEGGGMVPAAAEEGPAFVSDGWGRVTWTNEAYRRLVAGGGGGKEEKGEEEGRAVAVAWLVARGLVPAWGTCAGFACRVIVRRACRGQGKGILAAPCVVRRLVGGGYVWRLDVKAALSLGLGLGLSLDS